MKSLLGPLKRVLKGEDIVLVRQSPERWDAQFTDGKWARLKEGQPNTVRIAELILATPKRPLRVLDVGCGNGGLAKLIAGQPGIEYHGTDLSASAIEQAKANAPAGAFSVASAEAAPSGVYDIVVFNEIFFYCDPRVVIALYGKAMPEATLIVSVVRSWRSFFVWNRVRAVARIEKRIVVSDDTLGHSWDIALAHAKPVV